MATPLIAGNWKMNKLVSDALPWADELLAALQETGKLKADLLLNVPFTHLHPLATALRGRGVRLGAQDLSEHDAGAYTGEVSGAMLRDVGADYVLVGHSERRQYQQENDFLISAKVRAAQRNWLVPILCVGESAEQRDEGQATKVVLDQLQNGLDGFELASAAELVIAYEPVWSIGTGRTATPADAQEMSAVVRAWLSERFPGSGEQVRILYGGSMNPGNAAELLQQPDIDGGLIGGASLKVEDLISILESVQ